MNATAPTIAPLGSTAPPLQSAALETLFQRLSELSSLPGVALRIIEAAVDEESDAHDLRQLIEHDPALAARIIRVVNSSYFAVRQEVADLSTAIAMLGTKQIRNIAVTVFVSRQFQPGGNNHSLDRNRLWNHSLGVAAIARLVARTCRQPDPEEAYLAGLLHDIGLLIIDQHLSKHVPAILQLTEQGKTLHEAAQDVLQFDPTQLGAYVAWRSQFPQRLVSAIEFHHKPEDYEGEDRWLTDVVAVSDYIATRSGAGVRETSRPVSPSDTVFHRLGLEGDRLRDIWGQIEETLASVQSVGRC